MIPGTKRPGTVDARLARMLELTWDERVAMIAALGRTRPICERCGASVATYVEVCRAAEGEPCPGSRAVAKAIVTEAPVG